MQTSYDKIEYECQSLEIYNLAKEASINPYQVNIMAKYKTVSKKITPVSTQLPEDAEDI